MDEPLLQTKFYVPVLRPDPATGLRAGLVPRPRLIQRLDEGLTGKLSLISAPAGFGKTTLVGSWLEHAALSAAWLSLDEDDRDLPRFLAYLIAALQTLHPGTGAGLLHMLQAAPLPPSHTLLTLLINDLTDLPEKSILVLDDFHTIETGAIDDTLAFFIDHLPPLLHLVITSRVDPNLPVSRLRANGQLNELTSADLRFTREETARFLEQMTDVRATPAAVAELDRRTEGWIAGLQMMALSLRQREALAAAQFIQDFGGSNRYIMDYLFDEVFQRQPVEVQTFLLHTSILDRLCAPLCAALLGEGEDLASPSAAGAVSRAQELLEYLEHANLFINPLDNRRQWYRYHPLFADLLRHRLQMTDAGRVATLHLRASQWYEQAGSTGPALQHALAGQAFDRAAGLVEQAAPAMIQRSELARLLGWLDALPDEVVQARPLLALYYAWGLFLSGQVPEATARLEAVEARAAADEARCKAPRVLAHIAALRAYLAREAGDFATTIALSRQALAGLPEQDSLPRAMVIFNLAVAHYLQGEFDLAVQLLTETIALGQTAQLAANTLASIYLKAQVLRAQGSLQGALRLCQEGLELIVRRGWENFPAAGFVYVALGDLLRERNDLAGAAEYLEKGIRLGQAGAHPHITMIGHVWLAWLRQTWGDAAGSQEAVQAALQLAQLDPGSRFWPMPPAACCQARLWIAQGNLVAASRWAQVSGLDFADTSIPYLYEVDYLTLARLLIAQRRFEDATTLLFHLHRTAAAAGRGGSLIEILILQAVSLAGARAEEALPALARALALAEPEGFIRLFLDEGPPLAGLLRRAAAQNLNTPFALRLLAALGEAATASQPPQPLGEPLSERELEVLRRVAAGYSNNEIAGELVVAVSTVKKHINNIYGKLEVRSRTQAVARATELGLL